MKYSPAALVSYEEQSILEDLANLDQPGPGFEEEM